MEKDKIIAFTACPLCGGKLELIGTDGKNYRYQCNKCYKKTLNDKTTELIDKSK